MLTKLYRISFVKNFELGLVRIAWVKRGRLGKGR